MPKKNGAASEEQGLSVCQVMQRTGVAKDGSTVGTVQDLVDRKSQIDREIREVQKQIYELESSVLDEWKRTDCEDGPFFSLCAEPRQRKIVLPEERFFSNSSVY